MNRKESDVGIKYKNGNAYSTVCPYDVDDVYVTFSSVNPATRWPGTTWALYAQDRFPVGAGSSYALRAAGGAATHSHALNGTGYAGICTHSGKVYWNIKTGVSWKSSYQAGDSSDPSGNANGSEIEGTSLYGSTGSSSSMPPYIAVNIWRHTA